MTFRARPTTKPVTRGRRSAGGGDKGSLYVNFAFGAVIVLAILLFAGAAFANWFDQHFSPAATVNGVTITKDQVAQRVKIETFRLKQWEDRTRERAASGKISGSMAQSIISYIDSVRSNLDTAALSYEEDSELIRQLVGKQGLTITDADIDAQFRKDATQAESRHTYVITIKPEIASGASEASAAQKKAAREKAQKLVDGLKSGTSWEDTVKASGDADAAASDGDLYYIEKTNVSPDRSFVEAIFALPAAGTTEVIEGSDGSYRIGRVTDILAESVDPTFEQKMRDAGVDVAAYRNVDRAYVAHDKLEAKILAEVVDNPSEQRKAAKLVLDTNNGQPTDADAVLVKHLLYSPNDAPDTAKDLKADDAAWEKAKKEAQDAYDAIKAGTSRFIDYAAKSDDSGSAAQNGFLGFYSKESQGSSLDEAFAAAIFKTGLTNGQLLEPVKSDFGWHVIQIVSTETPDAYLARIKSELSAAGADIAKIAADNSIDAETAKKGGDLGWIAKYQVEADEEKLVFALGKGAVSEADSFIGSDGTSSYARIYVVSDVQTRLPEGEQKLTLKDNAFNNWYASIKADPDQFNVSESP